MKWLYLVLAVALTCVFGLPFREYDTARLLPIRTLQAAVTEQGVKLVSEVGEGEGITWETAVQDLLYDPQTSGGLLVALPPERAERLLEELRVFAPWSGVIGEVLPQGTTALEIE